MEWPKTSFPKSFRKTETSAGRRQKTGAVRGQVIESIVVSALRPDLVLLDEVQRRVVLGEFTVPWEESIAEVLERKLLSYEELVAEIREKSYICEMVAFEVGYGSFPAASLRRFLKVAGVSALRKIIKECWEKSAEGSAWINRRFCECA
ncbi:Hypothetical predicted protein [Octopus vulgaris]|uniref:Uncharacterized protein n=1 Tax=Octopus vulgaris TaxID=6645 RepID=A0AA36AZ82_OCTVU|nr:Hypothetical predicted protein [Octopus vulgaris]